MNFKAQTGEIVQLGMDARYLEARKAVAERKMRLPPHPMLDAYVQRNRVYGFWADELLVHPEKNGVFQKGRDVKDAALTGMILPASYVPQEALSRKGVGLYVVPENVGEEKGKVIVHAESVIVLDGMIQTPDKWVPSKPHEITRIPLVVSPEEFERLPEEETRWLYRIAGEGVRPLVRGGYGWNGDGRRDVYADFGADSVFGVAGVAASEAGAPEKLQAERAPENKGVVIAATVEQVKALVENGRASLEELSRMVLPEKLEPLRRLVEALQIKE